MTSTKIMGGPVATSICATNGTNMDGIISTVIDTCDVTATWLYDVKGSTTGGCLCTNLFPKLVDP